MVALPDPTYDKAAIEAHEEWRLAFVLSEIMNDNAPVGWSKYIWIAKCLLEHYERRRERETMGDRTYTAEEFRRAREDIVQAAHVLGEEVTGNDALVRNALRIAEKVMTPGLISHTIRDALSATSGDLEKDIRAALTQPDHPNAR